MHAPSDWIALLIAFFVVTAMMLSLLAAMIESVG